MAQIEMGKKYRTVAGREVRILGIDGLGDYPVVASVRMGKKHETTLYYTADGKNSRVTKTLFDLVEIPPVEEVWRNIYTDPLAIGKIDYPTRESALSCKLDTRRPAYQIRFRHSQELGGILSVDVKTESES